MPLSEESWQLVMVEIGLGITLLSLVIWLVLIFGRGQFWRTDQFLDEEADDKGKSGIGNRESGVGEENSKFNTLAPLNTQNLALKTLSPLPTPVRLSAHVEAHSPLPSVCAIIPARNEADLLPVTLRSLLSQTYPHFQIVLVDDHSTDGTADVARQTAQTCDRASKLTVIAAEPLPAGWTGKLWAMEQGIRYTQTLAPQPDYFLLTDADIAHHPEKLQQLVAKAQAEDLDLVSLMVLLRCKSLWETLLIPAFVFFFQKLYPFRWANDPGRKLAAAAGGCILIRREALEQIGGLKILREALIDDCSLAQAVKALGRRQEVGAGSRESGVGSWEPGVGSRELGVGSGEAGGAEEAGGAGTQTAKLPSALAQVESKTSFGFSSGRKQNSLRLELRSKAKLETLQPLTTNHQPLTTDSASGKIWLGLTRQTHSLRPYPSLKTIWDMVARTAYTQLYYSPLLLLGTLVGMTVIYLVPPVCTIAGLITGHGTIALIGLTIWLLMAIAYLPTLRLYQCPSVLAFGLPAIAFLYTLMTLDSALRHWRGQGGAWKGRVY